MQSHDYNSDIESRSLNNCLMFAAILKKKPQENKIRKIKKYLNQGADINASDANCKNNTPLHVAVLKGEPEVIRFLLKRGAQVNKKNTDNQSALDVALLSYKPNSEIVTILKTKDNDISTKEFTDQVDNTTTGLSTTKSIKLCEAKNSLNKDSDKFAQCVNNQIQSYNVKSLASTNNEILTYFSNDPETIKSENKICLYQKRVGTSGLSGQLYETKLLSLILFRALYVMKVSKFLIATNVENMGAFDDIVFRYSNEGGTSQIMFVQAKHRDNPARDKITVEEIMKLNGDFSLYKYLDSYLKIREMFSPDNKDDMFKGEFKSLDCKFIIYTSAFEKFTKMKVVEHSDEKSFLNTGVGKVFQFDYDDEDAELLVQSLAKTRVVLLAKRFSKFIFKDSYSNMMMDDLIKTFHVYLAESILEIDLKNCEPQNGFRYAKFRELFFTTPEVLVVIFKNTICKEVLLQKKNVSPETLDEGENILKKLIFKLPVNFGNLNFCFSGSEQKKDKKIDHLCLKFKTLFQHADYSTKFILMKVDDNMIGPNEILQSTDLETYRLGGLVGNLLIRDYITNTLKFNWDIDSLSEDNIKLFERLKKEVYFGIDISKCRFVINVHCFPRLTLAHDQYDKNLIKEFLSKLIFYTNQATEDEVEKETKLEIDKYFVSNILKQTDSLFRVKGDAIFLKVHDCIQKWWKKTNNAPYLTDSCEYFLQAKQDILNSPLLSNLHFTYIKSIKNVFHELKFESYALELLQLNTFFQGSQRILSIITAENTFSSVKLIQYFKEHSIKDYTFIDLDYIGDDLVDVKAEIKRTEMKILVVVSKNKDLNVDIPFLINCFKGKIIIISDRDLALQINDTVTEIIVNRIDRQTSFKDLADVTHTMLLEEREIVFQGEKVQLSVLFEDKSYHLINSIVLHKIINNEECIVGKGYNNPSYDEIRDYYVTEEVGRYVTLDYNIIKRSDDLNILKYSAIEQDFKPDTRDIVLITDKEKEFAEFINVYKNCNVHWFSCNKDSVVWKKSRGKLLNIQKYIRRGEHDAYLTQPMTLKDLKERVVIISAEPGMGKTSLLTYLAINTKNKHPALWISKIDLLENSNEFRKIKESKVNIDLKVAVQFLFRVIGFDAHKDKETNFQAIVDQVYIVGDELRFNKNGEGPSITGLKLFEIELFINCFNNDRVILLFDGFDEICPDFASEFMELVNVLKKSKVLHLWITSRLYNVLNQLENTLEIFSYTIQPLSFDSQLEFLEKKWWRKFGKKELNVYPLDRHWGRQGVIEGFLKVLSTALRERNNRFLGMPLHLYMISDIFQDSFHEFPIGTESLSSFVAKQKTMNKINLDDLYERFVDVKFFKIRFGEKKPLLCINDPDMRLLIENERSAFFHIHKLLAAYFILDNTDDIRLFHEHDIQEIYRFIERIKLGEEKTGVIEQIIHDEPKFVHYTFAEYFTSEFLCEKLLSSSCKTSMWIYLIDNVLHSEKGGLRRFFNSKLGNHPGIFNEIYSEDLTVVIEKLFWQQKKFASLLYVSFDEYLENIAMLLLKWVKILLNKHNLDNFINIINRKFNDTCIICIAAERSAKNAITCIIELISSIDVNRLIDLFNCSDVPKHNAIVIANGAFVKGLVPDEEILNALMADLPSSTVMELFSIEFGNKSFNISKKLIHIVYQYLGYSYDCVYVKTLEKLSKEQLMIIFSAKDSENKLAAHRAAALQSYKFFFGLDYLLLRNQFIKVCMTLDGSGLTPIHYFIYTKADSDKLEHLLSKVYEDNPNAPLTMSYFIEKSRNES